MRDCPWRGRGVARLLVATACPRRVRSTGEPRSHWLASAWGSAEVSDDPRTWPARLTADGIRAHWCAEGVGDSQTGTYRSRAWRSTWQREAGHEVCHPGS